MRLKILFVVLFYSLGICNLNAQLLNGTHRITGKAAMQKVRDTSEESPFGVHTAGIHKSGYANNGYGDAQNIGVTWTRPSVYAFWFLVQPDLNNQVYDFSQYDQQYGEVPEGLNILGNIAPQGNIDEGYCLPHSYMPIDTQKYIAFVKAVVERYDGDGIDDMPGLVNPIKYWQVGNEPNSVISGFADLQKITYTAIKEACPDCKVLIGGVPGMPPVDKYINNFDQEYKPILDSLGGKYVDILDFHWYGDAAGDYRGVKDVYNHIRTVLNKDGFASDLPVWITEMGAYSGDPIPVEQLPIDYPPQTETQQASDYFKRYVYSLSLGIKKIFTAFGLMEGFKYDDGYFDHTGLIYDGWGQGDPGLGVKKLSYYTYKKMTDVLDGSDSNNIQTIRDSGNIFACKFTKNSKPVCVAWWDYFYESSYHDDDTKSITLTIDNADYIVVTSTVPNAEYGNQLDPNNYSSFFISDTIKVVNGTAAIQLKKEPVFITPVDLTSSIDDEQDALHEFLLYQNYPNPFNPNTVISYQLPADCFVKLNVYDVLGKEAAALVNDRQTAGNHSVILNGISLTSGVYFYKLDAGPYHETKKLLLLR